MLLVRSWKKERKNQDLMQIGGDVMPEYNVAVKLHKNYPVLLGLFIRKSDRNEKYSHTAWENVVREELGSLAS